VHHAVEPSTPRSKKVLVADPDSKERKHPGQTKAINQRRRSFPGAMAAQALWYHAPPVRRTNSGTSCVIRSHPLMPSSGSADSIKCWHGDVSTWCGNPNRPEFQQGSIVQARWRETVRESRKSMVIQRSRDATCSSESVGCPVPGLSMDDGIKVVKCRVRGAKEEKGYEKQNNQ
jgi:hypothetical protein